MNNIDINASPHGKLRISKNVITRPSTKTEIRSTKPSRQEFPSMMRNNIFILLDNLRSGHNIGSIFRTSDALRTKKVFLCGSTPTPPTYKISRASKGAEKWVPWEYSNSATHVVANLKKAGVRIVAAEISENSRDYRNIPPGDSFCLVLGNEKFGVTPELLSISDFIVHIPMLGMQNSLNVSVVAGILGFHLHGSCLETVL